MLAGEQRAHEESTNAKMVIFDMDNGHVNISHMIDPMSLGGQGRISLTGIS